ncbi:hypothetical protein Lser_V15G03342 [Lactuca serriola]
MISTYTPMKARWVKSLVELNLIRQSASIGCQYAAIQDISLQEYLINQSLIRVQNQRFNPAVGGGPNGSVKDGELVLMDIGCELHGYVSTWPPCDTFSDVHREVYDLVVETNKECIQLCSLG